jgi:hypothetical protein
MSRSQKQFAILAGVVSVLIVVAWSIGGRQPVSGGDYGAVAVFVAIAPLGIFLER